MLVGKFGLKPELNLVSIGNSKTYLGFLTAIINVMPDLASAQSKHLYRWLALCEDEAVEMLRLRGRQIRHDKNFSV
ncbi:hypothetical protein GCM10027175_29090 [Hymenobacter latericoloratus]